MKSSWTTRGMSLRAFDVTKPLAAVLIMFDAKQLVVFAPAEYGESVILDFESGGEETLVGEDRDIIIQAWMLPPHALADSGRRP